ncbi:hypothetical protein B296_00039954 [Ensete ventricosum]|uniref:Uncharacterized protein n=1 Tax=Ensete ventricosum TaxID=4639 RepID=A0A426Y547_ENSVE|nr:hypothetical protein B296_00039954 [Ensete ventricosum]
MLSTASCLGQWIIIVSFPSLNKPSLFTRFLTSALALRDCIPDFFFFFFFSPGFFFFFFFSNLEKKKGDLF